MHEHASVPEYDAPYVQSIARALDVARQLADPETAALMLEAAQALRQQAERIVELESAARRRSP